jgi:hypothetical protein
MSLRPVATGAGAGPPTRPGCGEAREIVGNAGVSVGAGRARRTVSRSFCSVASRPRTERRIQSRVVLRDAQPDDCLGRLVEKYRNALCRTRRRSSSLLKSHTGSKLEVNRNKFVHCGTNTTIALNCHATETFNGNLLSPLSGSDRGAHNDIPASISAWNDGCLDAIAGPFVAPFSARAIFGARGSARRREQEASLRP